MCVCVYVPPVVCSAILSADRFSVCTHRALNLWRKSSQRKHLRLPQRLMSPRRSVPPASMRQKAVQASWRRIRRSSTPSATKSRRCVCVCACVCVCVRVMLPVYARSSLTRYGHLSVQIDNLSWRQEASQREVKVLADAVYRDSDAIKEDIARSQVSARVCARVCMQPHANCTAVPPVPSLHHRSSCSPFAPACRISWSRHPSVNSEHWSC